MAEGIYIYLFFQTVRNLKNKLNFILTLLKCFYMNKEGRKRALFYNNVLAVLITFPVEYAHISLIRMLHSSRNSGHQKFPNLMCILKKTK
jgi:hypothetical protein